MFCVLNFSLLAGPSRTVPSQTTPAERLKSNFIFIELPGIASDIVLYPSINSDCDKNSEAITISCDINVCKTAHSLVVECFVHKWEEI